MPLHGFNLDSNNSIPNNPENVNEIDKKYFELAESKKDLNGNKLSEGQQEYFKAASSLIEKVIYMRLIFYG